MIVLAVLDIIWFLFVGSVWGEQIKGDVLWNSLHGIHSFCIFTSVLVFLIKVFYVTLFPNN